MGRTNLLRATVSVPWGVGAERVGRGGYSG